jgi:hypothetical protein
MSNILLYKPGLRDGSENELPNIGMAVVAASIREHGDSIVVQDKHFYRGDYPCYPPIIDFVGMSLVSQEWCLEQTQTFLDACCEMHYPVIIGGAHAFSYLEFLEKDERIWKVVVGEVDGQWDKVINSKDKVVFLDKPDKLITPDFSDFVGIENMKAYPLYTSRGCTNSHCSFCVAGKGHGKYRKRDYGEAINELVNIGRYPSVKKIYIVDDCFTGDIEFAKQVLDTYLSLDLDKRYELQIINVRADQLDYEILRMIKKCGVKFLPIGVESADHEVFKHVGKGESLEDIRKATDMMQEIGITPWLNMITGLPYDNPERNLNSIKWCCSIPQPRIIHWFQMAPFRKTKAYDYFLEQGSFEDGFIPSAYGRRYDDFPWESDFETKDFSKKERMLANLEGYLRCLSPILVNSQEKVQKTCIENSMGDLYEDWRDNARIQEYVEKNLPDKKEKHQVG